MTRGRAAVVPDDDVDFCGNLFCLLAVGDVCTCRCGGVWHGAGRLERPPVNVPET